MYANGKLIARTDEPGQAIKYNIGGLQVTGGTNYVFVLDGSTGDPYGNYRGHPGLRCLPRMLACPATYSVYPHFQGGVIELVPYGAHSASGSMPNTYSVPYKSRYIPCMLDAQQLGRHLAAATDRISSNQACQRRRTWYAAQQDSAGLSHGSAAAAHSPRLEAELVMWHMMVTMPCYVAHDSHHAL